MMTLKADKLYVLTPRPPNNGQTQKGEVLGPFDTHKEAHMRRCEWAYDSKDFADHAEILTGDELANHYSGRYGSVGRDLALGGAAVVIETPREVLVLVHPGSACGSADFNLGKFDARCARDGLVSELKDWRGGIVVIDGALSDELPWYPALDEAIRNALERAKAANLESIRAEGDDPKQIRVARKLALEHNWSDGSRSFVISGAWYHEEDEGGCVGSVLQALSVGGCKASLSDYALCSRSKTTRKTRTESGRSEGSKLALLVVERRFACNLKGGQ
jgi:hypothetical protein